MFNIQLSCQNPDFGLPKTFFTWVCMQRAKFRQGMRRWDLWTGPREAHTRLEGVPVVMAHRLRALGRWPKSHHCRFPVTLVMLTSRFGPWALQNVLDMAVGAVGLVCLSLYRHYWLDKKKRQLLWKCISNVFWQTKRQIPFCWSLPICCPCPLELAACHAFTASCRASLISNKASPSFIWISYGWAFRGSISADAWISAFFHLSDPLSKCCFLCLNCICSQW